MNEIDIMINKIISKCIYIDLIRITTIYVRLLSTVILFHLDYLRRVNIFARNA